MSFRKICYSMRGIIWLTAAAILSAVLFSAPIEASGGDLSGPTISMGMVSVFMFAWAVWSSIPPKN